MGTSLIRNCPPLGPYSRPMPRPLWWSWGGGAVSYERGAEREFFIDNLLVRIHLIIEMIWWTGPAPCELEFPFPGSLISTSLAICTMFARQRVTWGGNVQRFRGGLVFKAHRLTWGPVDLRRRCSPRSSDSLMSDSHRHPVCGPVFKQKCAAVPRRARI